MKTTSFYLALYTLLLISCKNDVNETNPNLTDTENSVIEADSIRLEKYFKWQEKQETIGYEVYDTLALQKIESLKDSVIIKNFIAANPEILERYEYDDNPYQKFSEHLHLIDINGDNEEDIIFQGYSGGEGTLTQFFINIDGRYENVFSQFQYIHSLVFEEGKLTSFKIGNPGCCADPQFVEHQYSVSYSGNKPNFKRTKSIGYYTGMKKIKQTFTKEKEFTIILNDSKLRVDPYILDNVEHPMYGEKGNVIFEYKKGTKGKAFGYATTELGEWLYVLLSQEDGFYHYDYNEQKNIPSYTYGWILKSDTDLK